MFNKNQKKTKQKRRNVPTDPAENFSSGSLFFFGFFPLPLSVRRLGLKAPLRKTKMKKKQPKTKKTSRWPSPSAASVNGEPERVPDQLFVFLPPPNLSLFLFLLLFRRLRFFSFLFQVFPFRPATRRRIPVRETQPVGGRTRNFFFFFFS